MRKVRWFKSKWLQIKLIFVVLVVVSIGAKNKFWPDWTGLNSGVEISTIVEKQPDGTVTKIIETSKKQPEKNLWDLLGLLGVPLVLTGLGLWYQSLQQRNADEQAKEEMLQTYFYRLSELLIDKKLISRAEHEKQHQIDDEIRAATDVIQGWTRSILRRLEKDPERKVDVLQFLINTKVLSALKVEVARLYIESFDLVEIDLQGANLEGVNLEEADLTKANLSKANLKGANLEGATLVKANFGGADLTNATLEEASLEGSNFFYWGWRYQESSSDDGINYAVWYSPVKTCLKGTDLRGADFKGADLRWANLEGANLEGNNLEGAKISGIEEGIINPNNGDFEDILIVPADFTKARLRKTSLKGLDLKEVVFKDADLSDADLSDADLSGADLGNADLSGADLSGANINGTNLNGANLYRAKLYNAQNWTKEQLAQAKLCRTELPQGAKLNSDQDCQELESSTN